MRLLLSPELQVFLDEQIQSGKYQSEEDLYRTALQAFADREQSLQAKRQELREAVRIGTEQADRGEKIVRNGNGWFSAKARTMATSRNRGVTRESDL